MNITVYLGASVGNDPAFLPAVQELGNWIGSNGHALVYGGSKSGLMGALADSVLGAGGHVTGVEPSFLSRRSSSTRASTTLSLQVTWPSAKPR